jgi:hypothetical protein
MEYKSLFNEDDNHFEYIIVDGDITVGGNVDGRDVSADGKNLDSLIALDLLNLTPFEVKQLQNINLNTISPTQWNYLSLSDQRIDTKSPLFEVASLQVDGTITSLGHVNGRDIAQDGSLLDLLATTIGLSGLTTSIVNQLMNIGILTISATRWGYVSSMQDVKTTSSPTFGGMTLNGDVTTSGLLDGVDLSVFKTDYDSKIDQSVKIASSPTFAGATFSGLTASLPLKLSALKALVSAAINLASAEVTGILPVAQLGISAGNSISLSGAGVIDTVQDIRSSATPTFKGLTLNTSGLSSTGSVGASFLSLPNLVNQIVTGVTNRTTLNFPAPASSVTINLPILACTLSGIDLAETFTGVKTFSSAPVIASITNGGTITVPSSSCTLSGVGLAETFSGIKTFSVSPVIASITNTGTITFPTSTCTLSGVSLAETFSGIKTFSVAPVIASITNTGTITFPTSSCTLSGVSLAETFSGIKTFSARPVLGSVTNTGTITFPTSTCTLSGVSLAETVSGIKTFSVAPVIASITNTGTLTLPTSTDTLIGRGTSDTLTNKLLETESCSFIDHADTSKRFIIDLTGNTTTKWTTIATQATVAQTVTIVDGTYNLVGHSNVQSLTNKKLSNASCELFDPTDPSRTLKFSTSSNTTGIIIGTLKTQFSTAKTITFPDLTDNVVTDTSSSAMTNKTISFTNAAPASVLNYYSETTATFTVAAGAITTGALSVTLKFTRIGRVVTLTIPAALFIKT